MPGTSRGSRARATRRSNSAASMTGRSATPAPRGFAGVFARSTAKRGSYFNAAAGRVCVFCVPASTRPGAAAPELARDRVAQIVVHGAGRMSRIPLRRHVRVERDDVAGLRGAMEVQGGEEPVLVAAVADHFNAAVPFDEARQPGLHVFSAATLAVGRAD